MSCYPDLIEAYLDQELDPVQHAAVERHMAECPECSAIRARLSEQRAGIRAVAPYYRAPEGLERSIRDALRRAAASEPGRKPASREFFWRPLAIAASLLLALSVSWNLAGLRSHAPEVALSEAVLSDHLRSLLGTHLVDVASSDQHTVKPWFAGKLDFSPDVKDLDSEGFILQGGRIEYLADRPVAALVYRRRQHIINLFVWPAGAPRSEQFRVTRNGYNLLHWTDAAMTYWAVSDISRAELDRLRTLYQK
jgi:anti-sigma factor RsiW